MPKKTLIGFLIAIGVLVALFVYISKPTYNPNQSTSPPPEPDIPIHMTPDLLAKNWQTILSDVTAPAMGPANAPYTMVEIGDFQCPQCGKMRPVIEQMVANSRGQVKFYFINFPLPIHKYALGAALAGLSAAAQGKFWPMYDALYENQTDLLPSEIQYYAESVPGLNASQVAKDIAQQTYMTKLDQQMSLMNNIDVEFTPTLLLRKGTDPPSFYVGSKGEGSVPGILALQANPPWGR